MTQDEFREAMNEAKRGNRLLWVTNGAISGIALGYDSGTNEALLFKNVRLPLDGLRIEPSDAAEPTGEVQRRVK